jgi:putative membrane protein
MIEGLGAWAHFLSIFATFGILAAEAALYAPRMSEARFALLRRLDLYYMYGALAILATGLLRVVFFGKGLGFYAGNPVFWLKLALFVIIGLLSVPPTIHFIRSRQHLRDGMLAIDAATYRGTRRLLTLQLVLFAFVPLAASLMARGIGL